VDGGPCVRYVLIVVSALRSVGMAFSVLSVRGTSVSTMDSSSAGFVQNWECLDFHTF
jgi:hypothetical protein